MLTEPFELTALFEEVEGGWIQGTLAEVPGVITVAPTLGEARPMLRDALLEFVNALREPQRAGT